VAELDNGDSACQEAGECMTVKSIMSTRVITVSMDETLDTIRIIFARHRFHHIFVTNEKRLVGVISDRDLLKQLSPNIDTDRATDREMAVLRKRAHHIMSRKPVSVSKNITLKEAAVTLLSNNISCLPVVDENGCLDGVVSWKDILRHLVNLK